MLLPQLNIKLRPNNQITITRGNYRACAREVYQSAKFADTHVDKSRVEPIVIKYQERRDHVLAISKICRPSESAKLDIIKKSQRSKKAPSMRLNKPKSFTRFSGQRIREAGAAMDIACNGEMRFCHEVTLTLPANTNEAFKAIAAHSYYITNRLFQVIRRNYGSDVLWFFAWEYQKRGALHMHIAIYHPDECEGMWICTQLIEQWHKILCDLSDQAGTCMFTQKNRKACTSRDKHQHHTAPLKKSVAAYFAKYAGKEESKSNWYCQAYPVSRFWGSCKAIKEIIKRNSFEFTWDMMATENSYDSKFEEIIQSVLEKITIVSATSYDFNVTLKGKHRLNRYQNGRKIISFQQEICVASGTRYTFYTTSEDYHKAIDLAKCESVYLKTPV